MIDGLQPYPAYKESSVPWLGQVPDHWGLRKLKYAATFSGGGTPSKVNASFWNGQIPWVSPKDMKGPWITDATDHISDEALGASSTSLIAPGALLMVVRSGILQRKIPVAINTVPITINQDMKAIRTTNIILVKYLRSLVQGNETALIAIWTKQGATVESIEHDLMANSVVPIPSLPEQAAIVRFLDHADRLIHRYTRAKKKIIVLLKEQRQAIIHQVVTCGLDSNVKFKTSGVEWLGDVPEHWTVASLRFRYDQCLGKMVDAKKITGKYLIPYLRNIDVRWGNIRTHNLPMIDIAPHERDRFTVKIGDLLVCEGRHLGRSAFWHGQIDVCGFQKALHRLRPLNQSTDDPRFLYYCLYSAHLKDAYGASSTDNSIPHLTGEMLRAHRFPFPPHDEQTAIARYLDETTSTIDKLIATAQAGIALVVEYRTRLAADLVTGKLDVREASARLPDEAGDSEADYDSESFADLDEDIEAEDLEDAIAGVEA